MHDAIFSIVGWEIDVWTKCTHETNSYWLFDNLDLHAHDVGITSSRQLKLRVRPLATSMFKIYKFSLAFYGLNLKKK